MLVLPHSPGHGCSPGEAQKKHSLPAQQAGKPETWVVLLLKQGRGSGGQCSFSTTLDNQVSDSFSGLRLACAEAAAVRQSRSPFMQPSGSGALAARRDLTVPSRLVGPCSWTRAAAPTCSRTRLLGVRRRIGSVNHLREGKSRCFPSNPTRPLVSRTRSRASHLALMLDSTGLRGLNCLIFYFIFF